MTTLERYILRLLLGPLGFFVVVLTGVVWLTQSLRIIDIVVNNGQSARVFLEFTALLLPRALSIVLQLSALAATVYTLHRLISDSEVTAAIACGASRLRMTRPIMVFGLGLTAMLAVDTIYLMPTSQRALRERLAEVRGDVAASLIRDGRFLTPAPGLTVYIREITSDGRLNGVMVQDGRDKSSVVTYTAKSGYLTTSRKTPALVLFDGQAQRLEDGGERLAILRFDRLAYDLSSFISKTGVRHRKPSERFFWELIDPPNADTLPKKALGKLVAEGHEQLSAPLYGLALPLVAAALMLGAQFSRRGVGGAVAAALIAGAGLRVTGLAFKSVATSQPDLWPLLYAPPIAGSLFALWWLSRRRLPAGRRGAREPERQPALETAAP